MDVEFCTCCSSIDIFLWLALQPLCAFSVSFQCGSPCLRIQCVIPLWCLCFERVIPLWRLGAFSVSFQCGISLSVFSVCCATVAPHSVLLVCHSTVPFPCVCFSEAFHSAVFLSVLQCVIPLWCLPVCAFCVSSHSAISLSVLCVCHPTVLSPCLCFLCVIPLCYLRLCFSVIPM